ncbi:dTMP kinase [Candidatus Daviesbacteria bacterium]|nr:dTMP kinase [Candidatus Daviesbacteria bacterium]
MSLVTGKLIVFEGIDGSGKTTQANLLANYLKTQNIPFEVINFPRYEENLYGKLVRRYLEGEFGSLKDVNPYLAALVYAGDRALAKDLIANWLNEGKIVIANRYVSSSKAHLGANLKDEEKQKFIDWIEQLEYQTNKIPKEDLTIFLKVEPKVGQQNALDRNRPDIHEENLEHEVKTNRIYQELAAGPTWYTINCMENGQMKAPEHIHQELIDILNDRFSN